MYDISGILGAFYTALVIDSRAVIQTAQDCAVRMEGIGKKDLNRFQHLRVLCFPASASTIGPVKIAP